MAKKPRSKAELVKKLAAAKARQEKLERQLIAVEHPELAGLEERSRNATKRFNILNRTIKQRTKGIATLEKKLAESRAELAKAKAERGEASHKMQGTVAAFNKLRKSLGLEEGSQPTEDETMREIADKPFNKMD